jgi:hypothetical protein
MQLYKSKRPILSGSNYGETVKQARKIYHTIAKKTKRRPYIRSKYFDKEKVFLDEFWNHLQQKAWGDRARRIKFYNCAIDLLIHSSLPPTTKVNPKNAEKLWHRFYGQALDGERFVVQVMESRKQLKKKFISVFPLNKTDLPPSVVYKPRPKVLPKE